MTRLGRTFRLLAGLTTLCGAVVMPIGPSALAEPTLFGCIGAPAGEPGVGYGAGMYAEPRTYIEGQSWWQNRDAHAHLGGCVPADQTISGTIVTNFRLDLHNNTGYAKRLWQEVATDTCSSCGETLSFENLDATRYSCSAGANCQHWIRTSFNVNAADKSGWQQIQNRLDVRVADGTMRPAIRYMAYLNHGKTVDHYNRADTNGYAWHTNTKYAYARLKASTSTYSPTLPYKPVSGTYSFIASHETTTDGVSKNITGWAVSLDPALHASPPTMGTVLGEGGTSCTPYVKGTCHGPRAVRWDVDTRKLTDGLHWVAIFTHQADSATNENTGVLKFPIIVYNRDSSAFCGPDGVPCGPGSPSVKGIPYG